MTQSGSITTAAPTTELVPGQDFTPGDKGIKSLTATGTFGSGTVLAQGSYDGTNWFTLADGNGNAASLTAAGLKNFFCPFPRLRVNMTGSTGATVTWSIC